MRVAVHSIGGPGYHIEPEEFSGFVRDNLAEVDLTGKRVCLIIPDDTRSCPLPQILAEVYRAVIGPAASVECVIALGTHEYMTPVQIAAWVTGDPDGDIARIYPGMPIYNHEWKDEQMLVKVGTISANRIAELSGGRLAESSDIYINRRVVEADVKIIIGPVLPHEVVGISGGNKYFIPGTAQAAFIDRTHWVGALITSSRIIGTTGITPVRAMIDEGSALIPGEHYCLSFVVRSHSNDLESASFGSPEEAWAAQAQVAAQTHVEYVEQPFHTVISEIPTRYHDIWTAAKGFYKVEPAVAAGGEVILYAPHITELSQVHREIYDIGYHCRDFFVQQWERYRDVPWGVLAHSTHLRGVGAFDPASGVECDRVRVSLASGIPREVCESVNLGYRHPASIDLDALERSSQVTVIRDAGEVLYRLRSGELDGADAPYPICSRQADLTD